MTVGVQEAREKPAQFHIFLIRVLNFCFTFFVIPDFSFAFFLPLGNATESKT